MKLKLMIILLLGFLLPACALLDFVETNPATAQLTVQYATLKYIDGDQNRADRVLAVTERIRAHVDDDEVVTIAVLDDRLRSYINWGQLDEADTLLLNALLEQVKRELQERMGEGFVSEHDRVRLHRVIDWVETAAGTHLTAQMYIEIWYKLGIERAIG